MIRNKVENKGPIVIDLTGPDGNAFVLLGYAKQYAKQLKFDEKKIIDEMTKGDVQEIKGNVTVFVYHGKNKVAGPFKSHKLAIESAEKLVERKFKYIKFKNR